MRLSRLASSTAFCALLATSSLVTPAWAQKGSVLEPATQWAMSKVDEAAAQGPAYCAIARRFETDKILTIARNLNDEISLAVDFQRPRFNTKGNYAIILDPGAGEQRSYQLSPASNKAFVVRIGRDALFLEALAKTGHLRMGLGDQALNFNLADIDAGQAKLTSCLNSLARGGQGEAPPRTAQTGGAPAFRDELKSLQAEIADLRAENARISETLTQGAASPVSEEQVLADNLKAENDRLKAALAEQDRRSTEIKVLQAELEDLRHANGAVKQELAENAAAQEAVPVSATNELIALNEQIKTLKDENAALDLKLQEAHAQAIAQGQDQEALLAQLRGEIASLMGQLKEKDLKLLEVSELSVELESLKTENESLRKQLAEAATGEVKAAMERIAVLEKENEEVAFLKSENERLKIALNEREQLVKGDAAKIQVSLERQLNDERARSRKLQEQVRQLMKQLQDKGIRNAGFVGPLPQAPSGVEKAGPPVPASPTKAASIEKSPAEAAAAVEPNAGDETPYMMAEISEAQRQEEMLRQKMRSGETIAIERPAPEIPALPPRPSIVEDDEGDITINRSEDPFEGMEVVGEGESSIPDGEIRFDEQPEDRVAAPVAPVDSAIPLSEEPAIASELSQSDGGPLYAPAYSLQDLIGRAQIVPAQNVALVPKASNSQKIAFNWRAESVYGSAEQKPLARAEDFDAQVKEYLERTQQRCHGDFAIVPDTTVEIRGLRADSYEIACVGSATNSTASLLFIGKGGTFTAVAHEAGTEQMEAAMGMRDRLLKTVSESET